MKMWRHDLLGYMLLLYSGGGSFLVREADWEYRISGGRESGGHSSPDAEAISAFMWFKVHQNQHLGVI